MDNESGGRLYHLRPRLAPVEQAAGQLFNLPLGAAAQQSPPPLATIHVIPRQTETGGDEVTLTSASRLDYAWAAHVRLRGPNHRLSYRRIVSGGEVGQARGLVEAQLRVRAIPDCEELIEALQHRGRTLSEVYESVATRVLAADEHDCDCTCADQEGHMRWIIEPEAWRPVRVAALLRRLARGEKVKVRLAPNAAR